MTVGPRPEAICLMTHGGALIAREGDHGWGRIDSDALPRRLIARLVSKSDASTGEGDVVEIDSGTRHLVIGRGRFVVLVTRLAERASVAVYDNVTRLLGELERDCGQVLASWDGDESVVPIVRPYLQRLLRNVAIVQDTNRVSALPFRSGGVEIKSMKVKVCLVGERGTEKTALIRRHVLDNFDDKYIQTLGSKISKKELSVASPDASGELKVDMTIWDIMGSKGFRDLLKEAYFYGARGILAVCDVARKKTLDDLDDWIEGVYSVTGKIPIVLLGNKTELKEQAQVREADLAQAAKAYDCPYFLTSARTGLNVEQAFRTLAECVAKERYAARKFLPEE